MWMEEGEEAEKNNDPWILRSLIGQRVSKRWFGSGGLTYQSITNYGIHGNNTLASINVVMLNKW